MRFKIVLPVKVTMNSVYQRGFCWKHKKHYPTFQYAVEPIFKGVSFDGVVDMDFDFFFRSRLLDSSNCAYMTKVIQDIIVRCGVIKDDCPKYVGRVSMYSQKTKEPDDYCVVTIKNT